MQPANTPQELARMYPHLTPDQRSEMEKWHRGWIHDMLAGQATKEEYKAATPPYPEDPPEN